MTTPATIAESLAEEERQKVATAAPWPRSVDIYVHATFGESDVYAKTVRAWGWDSDDEPARVLSYLGYEHRLTFAVNADGSGDITHIDGRAVAPTEPR